MKIRKWNSIFALVLLIVMMVSLLTACGGSSTIVKPTKAFYVADYLDILTPEEEEDLINRAEQYANKSGGIQVVGVTVPLKEVKKLGIDHYTMQLFNEWRVGNNDKGIVALLAIDFEQGDYEYYVCQGKPLTGTLTYSVIDELGEKYFDKYVPEYEFYQAFLELDLELYDMMEQAGEFIKDGDWSSEKDLAKRAEIDTISSSSTDNTHKSNIASIMISFFMWISGIAVIAFCVNLLKAYFEKQRSQLEREQRNKDTASKFDSNVLHYVSMNPSISLSHELEVYIREFDSFDSDVKAYIQTDMNIVRKLFEDSLSMEYQYKANAFDQKASKYLKVNPDISLISELHAIICEYNSMNNCVKVYVQTDMNYIKKLYEDSVLLKDQTDAKNLRSRIEAKLNGVSHGKEQDLYYFEGLYREFVNLPYQVQAIVEQGALISILKQRIDEGKQEKRERERIEQEKRDMASAKEFDERYSSYTHKSADISRIDEFNSIIREYERLTSGARSKVNIDINYIRERLSECQLLKDREEAEELIRDIRHQLDKSGSGHERDLSDLEYLRSRYERKNSKVKEIVRQSGILNRLDEYIDEAKRERKKRQDDERREKERREVEQRRNTSYTYGTGYHSSGYTSHSNSHSSSLNRPSSHSNSHSSSLSRPSSHSNSHSSSLSRPSSHSNNHSSSLSRPSSHSHSNRGLGSGRGASRSGAGGGGKLGRR